jgi:hypothetical protein
MKLMTTFFEFRSHPASIRTYGVEEVNMMKNITEYMMVLPVMCCLAMSVQTANAQERFVPNMMNYQGYLTDTLGVPVNDSLDMTFRIFDAVSGGNELWTETQPDIPVEYGFFSILLGRVNAIPDTVFFTGTDRWLEMTVEDLQTLSPRTRITAAGFAYVATHSDTAEYAKNAVADNDWVRGGVGDTVLFTAGFLGLGRGSASNALLGDSVHTHTNFGIACTTGTTGADNMYCTVAGGYDNIAAGNSATIAGGKNNTASGYVATIAGGTGNTASGNSATVGGGNDNTASDYGAIVGGGESNTASGGEGATVAGGFANEASDDYATVAGGLNNTANGAGAFTGGGVSNTAYYDYTTVGGGRANTARAPFAGVFSGDSNFVSDSAAFIGGGYNNSAIDLYATISGGKNNLASGPSVTVSGGTTNTASGEAATVAGGYFNVASGVASVVSGGGWNNTSGSYATIVGGTNNTVSGNSAVIAGGSYNTVSENTATVGGGTNNEASAYAATVAGGFYNTASGYAATVAGGSIDTVKAIWGGVSAGYSNLAGDEAADTAAFIGGGYNNSATARYTAICGGRGNSTSDSFATIGGGENNSVNGSYSTVSGGCNNAVSGTASIVAGGDSNSVAISTGSILGGLSNYVSGQGSTIGGGYNNNADGSYSAINGGFENVTSDNYTFIGGGSFNSANDSRATVCGGTNNTADDMYATVAGGCFNRAEAEASFATNYSTRVYLGHNNTAVFTTSQSTAANQVRAASYSTGTLVFTMDHPSNPDNEILNQHAVGSSEPIFVYNGTAITDENGRAEVLLPDYFEKINKNARVQLTGVGTYEIYVAEDIKDRRFVIGGKPGTKVYWTVTGERTDIHAEIARIQTPVEQPKTGGLIGHSLDDDALIGIYDRLQKAKPGYFSFKTEEGRQAHKRIVGSRQ